MMRDNFDLMTMVPQDDDEAVRALERSGDLLTMSLQGIYRCRRGKGDSILEAFEVALKAHIEAAEKAMLDDTGE